LAAIRFRVTADGRFSYAEAGSAAAFPLVFLHGIGGAAKGWSKQLLRFAPEWRAIAWDMPGYGRSSPLGTVSIEALADALRAFLREVGADRPVLVGHSIGGMIVQELLARDPGSARAVVLAETSPAFGRPDGEWQRAFVAARLQPLDRGETMRDLAPRLVAELVGEDPDPEGIALARDCMAAVPDESYRAMMHALMGFDLRHALARIAVPTLVLAGSRDTNAPAAIMERMAGKIPGAAYACLDGVGHLAPLERPEAFNAAVEEFLRGRVGARMGGI
jgi:3-oxoadipate enol-lactonase